MNTKRLKICIICMMAIVVTNVCILEQKHIQESCKNAPKMFKYLQYEILLGKL